MNKILFFWGIFLMICSCDNEKSTVLNQSDKDGITREISASVDSLIAGWNSNKISTLFPVFTSDDDFTYVNIDGELYNYRQLIEISKAQF